MNLFIYLIVAAVIGWIATEVMHDRSNLLINIVVAVVGAFISGYFLSPSSMSGPSTMRSPSRPCSSGFWAPSSCWRFGISCAGTRPLKPDSSVILEISPDITTTRSADSAAMAMP